MPPRRAGRHEVRQGAEALLRAADFRERLEAWRELPARRAVPPLLSFLCGAEELLRWRAVTALGVVVARLAEEDPASARQVVRQLMWRLAEESGGMGWGAPEAMGEILARHPGLAGEFGHVLGSYLRDVGLLESPELLRGLLWGMARLAQAQPALARERAPDLEPLLGSADAGVRGLAWLALARAGWSPSPGRARTLQADRSEFSLYQDGELVTRRVCDAAAPGRGSGS